MSGSLTVGLKTEKRIAPHHCEASEHLAQVLSVRNHCQRWQSQKHRCHWLTSKSKLLQPCTKGATCEHCIQSYADCCSAAARRGGHQPPHTASISRTEAWWPRRSFIQKPIEKPTCELAEVRSNSNSVLQEASQRLA